MTIPEWFYVEHDDNNIWKPDNLNYTQILQEINELETLIQGASCGEREVLNYLKGKDYLFYGMYRDGHGTFVFRELKFGVNYQADYIVGSGSSAGILWDLIELESPQETPFIQTGAYSRATRKGLEQISDWRRYIGQNISTVQAPKLQQGQGLLDIHSLSPGIVVVGQRKLYEGLPGAGQYNQKRKDTKRESHIDVISYETLFERMRFGTQRRHDYQNALSANNGVVSLSLFTDSVNDE